MKLIKNIVPLLMVIVGGFNVFADDYIFCTDSYNTCVIDVVTEGDDLTIESLPDEMQFYPDSGTLLWNPDIKAIGNHHICLTSINNGIKEKTEINIKVKERKKVLCVFAHQDDEFGIMGKIIQLKDAGTDVYLAWTRAADNNRNNESRKAMQRIGISEEKMRFWHFGSITSPDGFLVYVEKLGALISEQQFDHIYVVGYEGGHIEHDLTHIATVMACRKVGFTGQIYEFGLYHLDHLMPQLFSLSPAPAPTIQISLDDKTMELMESLAGLYVTQKQMTLGFKLALNQKKIAHPCYRPLPRWDYRRPPSRGWLWYEVNLKHPASFEKHLRPVIKACLKTSLLLGEQSLYAQDMPESTVGSLVLSDKKAGEVISMRFPYSVYVYSGLGLIFFMVGWLLYQLLRKN
ncbi:MAG: PIG-L family deacetylase [Kiritimatiellae bacterium]|jgi:LmbE family N-acetylglucosaminyl deacetylase|nr:PIG-L family deacetylase [Kiritimatiellia bacterium]